MRGCHVSLDDVKEVYRDLQAINRKFGEQIVATIPRKEEMTDAQWEAHKTFLLKDAFCLTTTVKGLRDERLYGETVEVFDSPNLPKPIKTIFFTNALFLRFRYGPRLFNHCRQSTTQTAHRREHSVFLRPANRLETNRRRDRARLPNVVCPLYNALRSPSSIVRSVLFCTNRCHTTRRHPDNGHFKFCPLRLLFAYRTVWRGLQIRGRDLIDLILIDTDHLAAPLASMIHHLRAPIRSTHLHGWPERRFPLRALR